MERMTGVNCRNSTRPVWRQLFSKDKDLLYEGFTVNGKPYGSGTSYFPNGQKYQEGVFDIKGLLYGREYFPSGLLRFEGMYRLCTGYGPNYPVYGNCYDADGKKYYSGEIKIRFGGVGYPSVVEPSEFGPVAQRERPSIDIWGFEDACSGEKK